MPFPPKSPPPHLFPTLFLLLALLPAHIHTEPPPDPPDLDDPFEDLPPNTAGRLGWRAGEADTSLNQNMAGANLPKGPDLGPDPAPRRIPPRPLARRRAKRQRDYSHYYLSSERSESQRDRTQACEMLVAIDEPLFVHYKRSIPKLTSLVTDFVRRLNQIYHRTILRREFGDMYFRLKEIRILFDFCTECNQTQRVYLSEFSRNDYSGFCLAHIFTYRDFPHGVQGLAWKGTICRGRYNTGFTTLLNHQISATRADSAMTFAHEVGHNLGSDHDEDIGCSSSYLMSESGSSDLRPEFSACSTDQIELKLREVTHDPRTNCLADVPMSRPEDFSVCGDGIVEGQEECDCGLSYETCSDPCCYAAHIEPADLADNATATPCRRNRKPICLHPYQSIWYYGFVLPWIFILSCAVCLAIGLCCDWRHKKKCFGHITKRKEAIRAESEEQKSKRTRRNQAIYLVGAPTAAGAVANGAGAAAAAPERPKKGLLKQMKSFLLPGGKSRADASQARDRPVIERLVSPPGGGKRPHSGVSRPSDQPPPPPPLLGTGKRPWEAGQNQSRVAAAVAAAERPIYKGASIPPTNANANATKTFEPSRSPRLKKGVAPHPTAPALHAPSFRGAASPEPFQRPQSARSVDVPERRAPPPPSNVRPFSERSRGSGRGGGGAGAGADVDPLRPNRHAPPPPGREGLVEQMRLRLEQNQTQQI